MKQLALAEQITSEDLGITTGLFHESWWELYRYYFVKFVRSAIPDQNVQRNANIRFTYNTQVPIDTLIFNFCDEIEIDVETGPKGD